MSPTVQLSHGWTSSAEWTGVPLATILREVGIKPGGGWLLAEGADAAGTTAASRPPRRWPTGCSSTPPTARTCAPRRAIPCASCSPASRAT